MNCFQVNKYITLRLEDGKTNIYVNGTLFRQCKFLLLEIPVNQITTLQEVKSIDEAAEQLDKSLEQENNNDVILTPEIEFWGHCSNLQVWYENGYNTRLLHSNLAFPLLKKLTEIGDPKAQKVFKEEILKRLESDFPPVIHYLIKEKFISNIARQDLFFSILDAEEAEVVLELEKLLDTKYQIDNTNENLEEVKSSLSFENKKITRLQLVGHGLKTLPENVEQLKQLRYLYLNGNDFRILPEWIGAFKNLKVLDVMSCDLESLPKATGNLNLLRYLNVTNNYLKEFPDSIGKLINLSELHGEINSLKSLPDSIGLLKNLESLYLSENSINSIPDSIGNLINLKILDLELNKLESLPNTLQELINLERINISGNYFKTIPKCLYNLLKIKEIIIDFSLIKTIPIKMLDKLKSRDIYIGN
ncbi:hypothetical protein ES703_12376 [subsurface metagenome]